MRAYITPPQILSKALLRVSDALERYAPASIEIVTEMDTADLVILPVIGRLHHVCREAERLTAMGQRYAIIQYCLRSTQRPEVKAWLPLWENAALVWSYYDLDAEILIDGLDARIPNFYHAPLGVDSNVFRVMPALSRRYIICTSGLSDLTESVREAVQAARRVGRPVFHLGPELGLGPDVECFTGLDDEEVAWLYNQCEFVSGLRRVEGFELPAVEGLLCGARPILFDRHHYRQWFDGLAEFIPESSRPDVIDALGAVFRSGARPVSEDERSRAMVRFDWCTIILGFWERCV